MKSKRLRINFAVLLVVWLMLYSFEGRLLKAGALNTKDLPPVVGAESGTVSEYLLNIWHWDFAIAGLGLLLVPLAVLAYFEFAKPAAGK